MSRAMSKRIAFALIFTVIPFTASACGGGVAACDLGGIVTVCGTPG